MSSEVQPDGSSEEVQGLSMVAGSAPAFSDLMDFLVSEADASEAEAGGDPAAAAAAGDGQPAVAGEGALAAPDPAGAPAAGAAGEPGVPAAPAAPGVADAPAVPHANPEAPDAATLAPKFTEMFTGLETRQQESFQAGALAAAREEHGRYFEAIEKHPRELVNTQVPNVNTGELETLRDSDDAREWQDAIKGQLLQDVRQRLDQSIEQARPMMDTLHASGELFQSNPDLHPGTRQFDVELATEFVAMAKPYELRVEDKLVGYSIPVQPLLEQVRTQIAARRAAAPVAPAAPSAHQQRAADQQRNGVGQFAADAPQAGIPNRAGSSAADPNDFSVLFGTAGLPNISLNV